MEFGGDPMNEHDFQCASAMLDDQRKLIAAGKLQRWDVVKWAVTVNIALAAASIGFQDSASAGMQLFVLAAIVAVIGLGMMLYYNLRLTRTRNGSVITEKYLTNNGIEFSIISGHAPKCVDWLYDWQELIAFTLILGMSIVPTCVVWFFQ